MHASWAIHIWLGVDRLEERRKAAQQRLDIVEAQLEREERWLAGPEVRGAFRRLAALRAAGVLDAVAATDVLALLENVLPESTRVLNLNLHATPPTPAVRLEAVSSDSRDATTILMRLTRSGMVSSADVLEERRRQDGDYHLRIEADLTTPGTEPR